ncbi:FAD-binding oxidoreductase [Candidatus Pelagibacter sp. IMCC9063]|nr:FAD-binding oxidoreductase [Candidatus Pelagibacter sp. IMCC9063]
MKYDFIIVGSGIIGLTLAYKLKKNLITVKF